MTTPTPTTKAQPSPNGYRPALPVAAYLRWKVSHRYWSHRRKRRADGTGNRVDGGQNRRTVRIERFRQRIQTMGFAGYKQTRKAPTA